jgi:hypothetical protein
MVEAAFRVLLITDPAVSGVVADRVYHNIRPMDERRPSIVLQRVSTFFARTFGGSSNLTKGRMQATCLAESYESVKDLAAKVYKRLDNFSGKVEGVKFVVCEAEDQRDVPAAPLVGKTTPLYGVSIDFRFQFLG